MCDCISHLGGDEEAIEHTAKPASTIGRRGFLTAGAGLLLASALPAPEALAKLRGDLALNIRNQRTGEALRVAWMKNGSIDRQAVMALHLLTRDWREKRAAQMDVKLYLILSYIQHSVGLDREIILTSGYRTVETNSKLRSRGAAPNSYHIRGQALDFTVSGVSTSVTRDLAMKLRLGGVGYYPRNNYVHIDTGPIRTWRS